MIELSYFQVLCLVAVFVVMNLIWYAHGVLAERRDWVMSVERSNLHAVDGAAYRVFKRSETPSRAEIHAAVTLANCGREDLSRGREALS